MTSQSLKTQLQTLTAAEKGDALQILTETLSRPSLGITKIPEVMGGDACIAKTRLPVWLFVSLRQQGATDAELLESYPHLTAADLVNVWAYADAHPEEIAIALQEQKNDVDGAPER
ncbi:MULTISPECIES: DUF433 domain-containing protein [Cyanophyceae]|uniref:DUF433 domain-containing protein n=1 Tax=Cyanophyceae TaxID=3028117 RepID=UPI00168230C7|nr:MULTISPECIES: DUF433 domain-containing protein [Cyanophyceae]MBD1916996.1 DUF433 domain-containing protein [Phormidium sp. FACHB-77]MBD2029847.1 DUF433 domain-containing protein [Phormidium sp. FACHB-322]MBD2050365.1 DUF433 domain-containing protein [Leptolyngbya sp. FACHB-60]